MNAKRTICTLAVGTLFAVAAPAFASPPHWAQAKGHRHHHDKTVVVKHYRHAPVVREVVVSRPVVVRRTVIVERPVYVHRPVFVPYAPAPVYVDPHGAAVIGGAIIGAAIGSLIIHTW